MGASIATVALWQIALTCFGQTPAGWERDANLEKKMAGEGKWFVHWTATPDGVAARLLERSLRVKLSDLATLLSAVNSNNMIISSRIVPEGTRYPCIGFIGTTADNFPAELYVIVTRDHVYSVYAMTLTSREPPSKLGFNLAEWQSTITSDEPMSPGDQAKYETVLKDIKSKFDSGRTPTH